MYVDCYVEICMINERAHVVALRALLRMTVQFFMCCVTRAIQLQSATSV